MNATWLCGNDEFDLLIELLKRTRHASGDFCFATTTCWAARMCLLIWLAQLIVLWIVSHINKTKQSSDQACLCFHLWWGSNCAYHINEHIRVAQRVKISQIASNCFEIVFMFTLQFKSLRVFTLRFELASKWVSWN